MTALDELESATARLAADPFDAEALERRAAAVARLGAAGAAELGRLRAVAESGEEIRRRALVAREQLRALMAQSSRQAKVAQAYGGD